ncbi:MAG: Mitochondrial matrix cochaperone [Pycnora praestabilis]|nr:MAG: Mitochondrial matrix cochaperone [Pycnora praestabilis]
MIQRTLLRRSRARPVPLFESPQQRRIAPKWYSTNQEATKPTDGEPQPAEEGLASGKEVDPVTKELEAKNREVIELKDKYLRSVADFRNLQDRTKRDVQSAKDFAITRFAKDLVESVDNLDRALTTVPQDKVSPSSSTSAAPEEINNKDLVNLYEGLKMTETILMSTLKKHGLERFDPSERGERFDPNLHEATFMTPMEGKEDGTAFHTQQKGFLLNGRVLRAAKVGVVKNS